MEDEKNKPIEELCRRLRKDHALRLQAQWVLADPQAPVQNPKSVQRALLNPSIFRSKERAVASWLVRHANWTEDQRAALSETLSGVVDKALKSVGRKHVLSRWIWRGVVTSSLLGLLYFRYPKSWAASFSIPECCCLGLFTLAVVWKILTAGISFPPLLASLLDVEARRLKKLGPVVEALGDLGQPAATAPLATASTHRALQDVATSALKKVTLKLRPDDYGTLPLPAIPALCNALTTTSPKAVPIILQALAVIGDGRAVEKVAYLASTDIRSEVRAAAAELLPILQERDRNSRVSSMLLRASQAPEESGQTLLRPSWEQPTTDPSQLLRAALAEGNEESQYEK